MNRRFHRHSESTLTQNEDIHIDQRPFSHHVQDLYRLSSLSRSEEPGWTEPTVPVFDCEAQLSIRREFSVHSSVAFFFWRYE